MKLCQLLCVKRSTLGVRFIGVEVEEGERTVGGAEAF
jgi:hypothetical protein